MKVGPMGFAKWIGCGMWEKERNVTISQLSETAKENDLVSFYPDIFSNQKFKGFLK